VASGNHAVILDGYVSRGRLNQALRAQQFDVVHFALHGDYDQLQLSDGAVTVDELETMFSGQKHLQLIVLNACRSGGIAATLHNSLQVAVIWHQADTIDDAAVRYAEVLYTALLSGVGVHLAHERARDTISRMFPQYDNYPSLINGAMSELSDFQSNVLKRLDALESEMKRLSRGPILQANAQTVLMLVLVLLTVYDIIAHWVQ
jgi:hypothetical protein